jgi:dihydroorotate dehydrogenase (NAD+) catalytic subunit
MSAAKQKVPRKPEMAIDLAGIRMKNPVMVASGTFGYGPEYADLVDLNRLGAIVVKGISLEPWGGNRTPRMVEVPGGLVNAIGLQNPGVQGFIGKYMPFLRRFDVAVIVNIWGRTIEEYAEVAARFDDVPGVHGLEINISCPNIKAGGSAFGTNLDATARVVAAVRKRTRRPIIPKLAPNVADIAAFARACEQNGADALSLINSYPAMVIDVETRRPILANTTGGLSGPAIHPIAVKLVYEAARAVKIPIIAIGGVTQAKEALEFMIAGASAVAVGTANFTEPLTALAVVDGLAAYLQAHRLTAVRQLVGSLRP